MPFLKEKIVRGLRWMERYTKTDMVYVVREGFWSSLGQGIVSVSSAVVVILLANLLSKESFGQYRFVLSMIPILSIFALPGINVAVMRSIARGYRINFPKMVTTEIRWGFLGSLAALFVAAYYFLNGNTALFLALVLTAILLPFLQPFYVYSSYYKGRQNFKTATTYGSISSVFQAVVLIVVTLLTKNVLAILGAFLMGQILASLFFYLKTVRDERLSVGIESETEDQTDATIKYGKLLTATQVVGVITANIDKLIVGYFLGVEILAIYSVALTIPSNLVLIFNAIPRIAFPKFSKNTWESYERARAIHKLLVFLGALVIPALLYFLLAPFVIPLIFNGYGASIPTALILTLLVLISPLNALMDQIFQARKLVKRMIYLQIIGLAAFVVAFLLMYRGFGANPIDAATALIISEAVLFLTGIAFLKK